MIDISGDGANNDGRPVDAARDAAVAAGITINGLPILEVEPDSTAITATRDRRPAILPGRRPQRSQLRAAVMDKLLAEVADRAPGFVA